MRQELRSRIKVFEAQLQAVHDRYQALQQEAQHLALDMQRLSGGLAALRDLEQTLGSDSQDEGDPSTSAHERNLGVS
jgi:prefoldin subunit 5